MDIINEPEVRPKFLATVFLIVSIILLMGGWYTMGLWLPMLVATLPLFVTKSKNVVGSIPLRVLQIAFFAILAFGVFVHLFFGQYVSVSWYISAFFLSASFRFVRYLLHVIGIAGVFGNV